MKTKFKVGDVVQAVNPKTGAVHAGVGVITKVTTQTSKTCNWVKWSDDQEPFWWRDDELCHALPQEEQS